MNLPGVEGQSSPATVRDGETGTEFGDELAISTGDELNEEGSSQQREAVPADFDPLNFDWENGNLEDVPEQYRFGRDLNRRWQSHFDRRFAEEKGRNDRTVEELRQQIAQLQTHQDQQPPQESPETQAPAMQVDPTWGRELLQQQGITDPEQQNQLLGFMNLANAVTERRIQESQGGISQQLQQLQQAIEENKAATEQTQQNARLQTVRADLDETVAAYGGDNVGPVYKTMLQMYGQPGPDGKPLTLKRSYEILKGVQPEAQTQQNNGNGRVSPMVGVGGGRLPDRLPGNFNTEDAAAEIDKRLGF